MLPVLAAYSTFSQSHSSSHTHLKRGKSSFQKQRTWCHEVLILTKCANTSLPEKILWDGAIQAVLEGAYTHLVPEVHSDSNPSIQERLNVVPPAWKSHKKKENKLLL